MRADSVCVCMLALSATTLAVHAQAATIHPLHRFACTNQAPGHYALSTSPQSDLLQASDGSFYGTTV